LGEHVTFFRGRALPGKRGDVLNEFGKWGSEQQDKATGFERFVLAESKEDPDEFMGAVFWDTSENYFANANRPEQDAWYKEWRASLVADPVWFDGVPVLESI
jgi:heme-degrading monooxygenase HmoA